MSMTERMVIDLPIEQAQLVRAKVESGEYASESEAVSAGLASGFAYDEAFEHWVRAEIVPAYEEFQKDPSSGMTPDEVRESLAEHRTRRA